MKLLCHIMLFDYYTGLKSYGMFQVIKVDLRSRQQFHNSPEHFDYLQQKIGTKYFTHAISYKGNKQTNVSLWTHGFHSAELSVASALPLIQPFILIFLNLVVYPKKLPGFY